MTIGGSDDGLSWGLTGSLYGTPYTGAVQYTPPILPGEVAGHETTRVKIGGVTDSFNGDCSSGCAQNSNTSGRGSTLARSGAYWVYTSPDGTVYRFDAINNPDASQRAYAEFLGKLLSITRPNGNVVTINYDTSGCTYSTCYSISTIC